MRIAQTVESDPASQLAALVRDETDVGLLKLMARRNQDETWAEAALAEFYSRHKGYLWTVCSNVAAGLRGDAWIEDIFEETFERAYDKAGTFKLPENVTLDRETRLVRGWLGKIAANALRCLLRNHRDEYTQVSEAWEAIIDEVSSNASEMENEPAEANRERKLIDAALETLSEREQLVLRTTFQYYRVGERFQRLPNKVSQELAEKLGTTPENLRKIRERSLKKVNDYVHEHLET